MIKTKNTIEYHKVVDILIFNNQHDLALQKRVANDKSFPNHWDFSAGGHIDQNEDGQKAAERELYEELGINGEPIFISNEHFQYPAWNSNVVRKVNASIYKMIYNGPFKIDSREVEKVSFFSLKDIQKIIEGGIKFHPEFLLTWKRGIIAKAVGT